MKSSYYKYFAALLLFGSNGIVASNINLPSYEIVLLRLLLGSLFLITVFTVSRQRFTFYRNNHTCLYLFISASAMGASWMLLYEAYQQVGISIASLAYYCGPVIVMILSPFLFRETLTWPKIAGFLTVLAGMCLVNLQALDEGKTIWGLFCGLMSAFMYALMVTANKKAKPESGLENSLLQLVIGSFIVVAFVSMQKNFVLSLTTIDWIPVLLLGLLNTGIGCYLYFSSITDLPVQTVAICGYLEPLSAVVFSVLFLHEVLLPLQMLGAVLILGGAIFGECFNPEKQQWLQSK